MKIVSLLAGAALMMMVPITSALAEFKGQIERPGVVCNSREILDIVYDLNEKSNDGAAAFLVLRSAIVRGDCGVLGGQIAGKVEEVFWEKIDRDGDRAVLVSIRFEDSPVLWYTILYPKGLEAS